ncbi:hypothetical protein MKX03_018161 [Papaver bracteatum]|nr:hypothetical protein MKX03_018161 [Papaver bracteatum]
MTKKKEPVQLKRKVSKPLRKVDYNKIRGSFVQLIVIKEEDLSDVDQRNEDLSDVVEKIDGVASEIPAKRRKLAASSRELKKTETSTTLVVLEAQNQEHVVPKLEGCTDVVVFEGESSSALVVAQVPKLEVSTNIVRSKGATSKGGNKINFTCLNFKVQQMLISTSTDFVEILFLFFQNQATEVVSTDSQNYVKDSRRMRRKEKNVRRCY